MSYKTFQREETMKAFSPDQFFNPTQPKMLPCAIKQISIENYQGIIKTNIADIPVDTQWIFLTGENGFGKTMVLQAIAISLFGNQDQQRILTDSECQTWVEFKNHGDNQINILGTPQFQPFTHLVTYGSSRLEIQSQQTRNKIYPESTTTYGLFHTDGILLSIEYELLISYLKKSAKYAMIKNALLKLLPLIADIQVNEKDDVVYVEKEHENSDKTYDPLPFDKLASGPKNIIAMIGDMLVRFYAGQPEVIEPQDFCGIVLIDELDLHLHPKWQRQLPKLLSTVFPNVQFIASTHSVIPFLGAPTNSVFLKVSRSQAQGITIARINIDISNLLPNSLLTSPLFGLEGDDIKQENNRRLTDIRTEETYDDIKLNDEIRASLKAFEASKDDFPDDLFDIEYNELRG
jgi:predicted ATP-dependent endonuclease of OLD family